MATSRHPPTSSPPVVVAVSGWHSIHAVGGGLAQRKDGRDGSSGGGGGLAKPLAIAAVAVVGALAGAAAVSVANRLTAEPTTITNTTTTVAAPTSDAPDAGEGLQDSRYKFIRKIGRGRFGAVYQAHLRGDESREVAIKVIPIDVGDEKAHAVALQEFKLLETVNHPAVVKFYDAYFVTLRDRYAPGEVQRELRVVMQYCSGGCLAYLDGIPAPAVMMELCRQVISGLCALHERVPPIQHFDIKPENICLLFPITADPSSVCVKLVDFGMAAETMSTISSARGGSQAFWSPERVAGRFNLPDDVWAAGLTLLMVGVGMGDSNVLSSEISRLYLPHDELYTPRLEQLLAHFKDIHGAVLGSVLQGMLNRDPSKRYTASDAYAKWG